MTRMQRALCGALIVTSALTLHAVPASPPARFEYSQVHMGMPVRIVLHASSETAASRAALAAFARIAALDREMSDYRPDSALSVVARLAPTAVPVPPDLFQVTSRAIAIARATGGAFDPTVAPVVALWREARALGQLPDLDALDRARALTGWSRIELDADAHTIRLPAAGMRLDLGGIAKGYILGEALEVLRARGIQAALLQAGGDIVVGGAPPHESGWRIELPQAAGIGAPFMLAASELTNAALATSGPSAQFMEIGGVRYSHVIDPRSGQALTSGSSAHVIAADGATADALATAATVLGPAGLPALRASFPDARIELALPQAPPPIPVSQVPGDRSTYEWIALFNGKDLSDWTPKFARHPLGVNLHDTFRVVDGVLQVRYDKWTGFNG